MGEHKVVTSEEWRAARVELLAREKEFTRLRDELSRQRRELPWQAVTRDYRFEGATGSLGLADLFDGHGQLVVYHFMFPPEWDAGCPHCSFWADTFNGLPVHLAHRDVTFVAVSRAPYQKLAAYRERMGWDFTWVSCGGSDFNYDYQVSFTPDQVNDPVFNYGTAAPGRQDREAVSVFARDEHGIYHTYSTYGRGIDMLNAAYHYLDLAPRGRDEGDLEFTQAWVRRHDEYGD